jgi:hypothetical protein
VAIPLIWQNRCTGVGVDGQQSMTEDPCEKKYLEDDSAKRFCGEIGEN